MPTIVLARHGPPDWDFRTPIPGDSLAAWVQGVDGAPLDPSQSPPPALVERARSSALIAASPLRRSLESARRLAPGHSLLVDPVFREVPLPTAIRSRLHLPPRLWNFLARSAWYCGWSPGVESFAEARCRAAAAAAMLADLAAQHGHILLAAHGVMNGLIGARLRRCGWRGPRVRPRRYWASAVYESRAGRVPLPFAG
jgi:broad specificity phosphatase PhoE